MIPSKDQKNFIIVKNIPKIFKAFKQIKIESRKFMEYWKQNILIHHLMTFWGHYADDHNKILEIPEITVEKKSNFVL